MYIKTLLNFVIRHSADAFLYTPYFFFLSFSSSYFVSYQLIFFFHFFILPHDRHCICMKLIGSCSVSVENYYRYRYRFISIHPVNPLGSYSQFSAPTPFFSIPILFFALSSFTLSFSNTLLENQ